MRRISVAPPGLAASIGGFSQDCAALVLGYYRLLPPGARDDVPRTGTAKIRDFPGPQKRGTWGTRQQQVPFGFATAGPSTPLKYASLSRSPSGLQQHVLRLR